MILKEIMMLSPDQKIPSRPAICKKYNVTRTTVARAINELKAEGYIYASVGSGTFVSPNMEKLLGSQKKTINSWGVILPNVMEDIYPGLIRGIEDVAEGLNTNVVVCNSDNDMRKQNLYITRLIESNFSGCIIVPVISREWNTRGYQALENNGIPFVFCSRGVESVYSAPLVCSNDYYGGYLATKHLLARGYRRIAYISRILYKSSLDRMYGYAAALMEAGYPFDRSVVITNVGNAEGNRDNTCEKALMLLLSENPPDAFFCFSDSLTQGVYQAVKKAGLTVSDDIGVVGYNNTSVCEKLRPEVTSIAFKNYDIGKVAANILTRLIDGEKMDSSDVCIFLPEIAERSSCRGKTVK